MPHAPPRHWLRVARPVLPRHPPPSEPRDGSAALFDPRGAGHTQAPRVLRPDRRALCACDFAAVLLDRFGGSCPTREGPGRAGFPLGVAGASGRAVPPLFPALAGRRTPRVFEGSPRPGRAVCRVVYPPSLSGETEKPLLADPAVRYRARGAVLGRFLRTAVLGFSSEVAARVLSPGVSCSAVPEPRLTFLSHSGGSKLRGEEEPGEAAPALSHSRAQTRPCLRAHPTYPQGVTSASVWLVGYRLRRSACRSDRSIYIYIKSWTRCQGFPCRGKSRHEPAGDGSEFGGDGGFTLSETLRARTPLHHNPPTCRVWVVGVADLPVSVPLERRRPGRWCVRRGVRDGPAGGCSPSTLSLPRYCRSVVSQQPFPRPPGWISSAPRWPPRRFGYLVDPASSICLSQRLSHACLSTHGRYSETANGSLNQLWFL